MFYKWLDLGCRSVDVKLTSNAFPVPEIHSNFKPSCQIDRGHIKVPQNKFDTLNTLFFFLVECVTRPDLSGVPLNLTGIISTNSVKIKNKIPQTYYTNQWIYKLKIQLSLPSVLSDETLRIYMRTCHVFWKDQNLNHTAFIEIQLAQSYICQFKWDDRYML